MHLGAPKKLRPGHIGIQDGFVGPTISLDGRQSPLKKSRMFWGGADSDKHRERVFVEGMIIKDDSQDGRHVLLVTRPGSITPLHTPWNIQSRTFTFIVW